MRAKATAEKPDSIEFTVQITMPLGDWKMLKKQLETDKFPSWQLSSKITDIIIQAEKNFYPSLES
jgi:hypothetical protein